jgi:hypothetical protein
MRKNRLRSDPGAPTAVGAVGEGSGGTIGCKFRARLGAVVRPDRSRTGAPPP